ncbi:DUF6691 family protein [Dichotomicrobium thermohalophilum]|uniref:Uncharacterized protein n=1 Tax=Dichotomicrobium thermohalophilum TaxID=933063 RepID=A0A397Q6A7_9HYPH|nr:DUF6691 family protein [Dichotomicrobium thermohalophilum]RIA55999.1 hypothetical protein BXY53_1088 [Dichotomicrobium thermohalophilum]
MDQPLYDNGVAAGLLAGVLFGYILEAAGFGSPRKLTAQFRLQDWAVFKVMFTAVLVAAVGLWLLEVFGIFGLNAVYVPTTFFWAMGAGGLLIGAGFAIGGYCPGTSVAGLASGRLDALVFMLGMVIGVAGFAWVYEPLQPFYTAAQGPQGQTLPDLFGVPSWVVLGVLIVIAIAGWMLGSRLERRFGGPFAPPQPERREGTPIGQMQPGE